MPLYSEKHYKFWQSFLTGVGTEPRAGTMVPGISGFSHEMLAGGIDKKRKRIILVSAESDARIAALAHSDIQQQFPKWKLITVRPIALDLSIVAKLMKKALRGKTTISTKDYPDFVSTMQASAKEHPELDMKHMFQGYEHSRLSISAQLSDAIRQIFMLKLTIEDKPLPPDWDATKPDERKPHEKKDFTVDFGDLANLDVSAMDRHFGHCPIELYDFKKDEAALFQSGTDVGEVDRILRHKGVLQYFFPSSENMALGIIGVNGIKKHDLIEGLKVPPRLGHPFDQKTPAANEGLLEILKEKQVVEVVRNRVIVTPDGQQIKEAVRVTKEGAVWMRVAQHLSKIKVKVGSIFNFGGMISQGGDENKTNE